MGFGLSCGAKGASWALKGKLEACGYKAAAVCEMGALGDIVFGFVAASILACPLAIVDGCRLHISASCKKLGFLDSAGILQAGRLRYQRPSSMVVRASRLHRTPLRRRALPGRSFERSLDVGATKVVRSLGFIPVLSLVLSARPGLDGTRFQRSARPCGSDSLKSCVWT